MNIIISKHARQRMIQKGISKKEIECCLIDGKLIEKKLIKGEIRFSKIMEFKDEKIVVVYVHEKSKEKVITCYPIKRKKRW